MAIEFPGMGRGGSERRWQFQAGAFLKAKGNMLPASRLSMRNARELLRSGMNDLEKGRRVKAGVIGAFAHSW
jgi:hypothetical protein